MFIELEDDIFDDLETIKDPFAPKIMAIDSLFDAMYKQKHIVFSKIANLSKISNQPLLNERTRFFVSWIMTKFSVVYGCRDSVQKRIYISGEVSKIEKGDNYYKVPISYVTDVYETKLLTEHESDGMLYQQITRYIMSKGGGYRCFSITFDNDSYHGANAKAKIKQISEKEGFALCIVDTDRDYPKGKVGDTCRCVKGAVKDASKAIVIDLFELPVREKENLFPAKVYKHFTKEGIVHVLSDKFSENQAVVNYFDIKDGVKNKQIRNQEPRWIEHYQELIEECRKQHVCNESLDENDLDKRCITGIGDKLCESVADALFEGGAKIIKKHFPNMTKQDVQNIDKERGKILNDLPSFVIDNWTQISKAVFTWGCCIDKGIFPAQRDW